MSRKKQKPNQSGDRVKLEPNKYPSLAENLNAKGINPTKLGIKSSAKSLIK